MNSSDLGFSTNSFQMTYNSVTSIFTSIKKVRICKGVTECNVPLHSPNILKVVHSSNGCDNQITSYHSTKCNTFIPIKQYKFSEVCSSCKILMKKNPEVLNENIPASNDHRKPISYNPNNENEVDSENCQDVLLSEADDSDMQTILDSIIPDCPPKVLAFLKSQQKALKTSKHGRRWDKDIVRMCLSLWCRSPRGYKDLRESGFMVLPSQRLLQIHKNKVHQKPGVNKDLMHWMRTDAECKNLPPEGYEGGLILDEMSIQPDLQFYCKDGRHHLIGFTDLGEESYLMNSIQNGKNEVKLATHVLQFTFLGFTGFRFPLFHYPTMQASASDLYLLVWKIIQTLDIFGFNVQNINTDGAATNRDLAKILLGDFSSISLSMKIQNVFSSSPKSLFFIMDYSHLMKKIRNNISKSLYRPQSKRCLYFNNHYILWEHFYNAYMWDLSTNPFTVHKNLSNEHFNLTGESKMRNHLAEEVLNKDMLHLVQCYALSLKNPDHLSSTIELLTHTSVLIENFRDTRPITDKSDQRLLQNKTALDWFLQWEKSIKSDSNIKNKERCLISHQTRADITSLLLGFHELCEYKLEKSSCSIVPSRVNSDIIENLFSQQRGIFQGNNTNPTYLTYCRTMNSVILSQPSISRKSNAADAKAPADPMPL